MKAEGAVLLSLIVYLSVCTCTALKIITAVVGENVILLCQGPNNNNRTAVEWNKLGLDPEYVLQCRYGNLDSHNQHPSYQDRVYMQCRKMKDGNFSMILMNVAKNDSGIYYCRDFEENNKPICELKLEVVDPGNKAEITGDGGDKDGGNKDRGNKDGVNKDGGNKDEVNKVGGNKDAEKKDGVNKDAKNKDGRNKDGRNKDGGNKDGRNKEEGNRDGRNKDGGNKDGRNKDGGNKDGRNMDGGNKDEVNKDAENKDGVNLVGITVGLVVIGLLAVVIIGFLIYKQCMRQNPNLSAPPDEAEPIPMPTLSRPAAEPTPPSEPLMDPAAEEQTEM